MEAVVLIALVLVVVVKAATMHRMSYLESSIRTTQADEAEVIERLHNMESTVRQLEQDYKTHEQEIKHLENDKDLISLEVTKLGGKPITEAQLEAMLAPPPPSPPQKPAPDVQPQAQEAPQVQENTPPAPPDPAPPVSADVPDPQNRSEKPRILVVDDNQELRKLLQQALEKEYDVLESPDGFDALTKILKEKQIYDLIITDLNMPKINGIVFLENLPPNTPTIIISAFIDKPEFKQALERLKPREILQKPFQIATLRRAIKNALSPRSLA